MHKFIDGLKANYKIITLLLIMMIIYFYKLSSYPLVNLDETWMVEPSWNFLRYGKFINLTFTGYFNKDTLDLIYPAYHFLLIPVFKIFGLSITAARGMSVILGVLTVALVYSSVKLIYKNETTALCAAALLMLNSVFFICSRDMRPEAYVTFFAVLGFYLLVKAADTKKTFYYFFCGASAGVTLLCHPIGSFVIFTLFCVIAFTPLNNKDGRDARSFDKLRTSFCVSTLLYYSAGVIIVVFSWALYMFAYSAFYEQILTGLYGGRFAILNKLLINVLTEYKRWVLLSVRIPALFGFASLIYLLFITYKKRISNTGQYLLVNYTFIFMVLLCAAEKAKNLLYVNFIFPFFAMTIAGAFYYVFKKKKVLAVGLIILLLCASGVFIPYKLYKFSGSDYGNLLEGCRQSMPKGAVVMAQANYWFGLEKDYAFRTVETFYMYKGRCGISLKNAVKVMKVNYIIFDDYWKSYFKDYYAGDEKEREDFFKNDCILVKTITDKYYGQESEQTQKPDNIKIYKVK